MIRYVYMIQFDDDKINERLDNLYHKEKERVAQSHAAQTGFEYINLQGRTINPIAIAIIPEEKSKETMAVCFLIQKHDIMVAATNPGDQKTQSLIQDLTNKQYKVRLFTCSQNSLEHAQKIYKDLAGSKVVKKGVFEIDPEDVARLMDRIKKQSDIPLILQEISQVSNTRRISETLELIFAGGLALKASDIHIEPEKDVIRLRYRLYGVLHDIVDIDSYIYKRLISRLKVLSGMVLNAKEEAQDGRFTFNSKDGRVEVRSSIIPGAIGESVVMRLLDPNLSSFDLDKIKLNPYIGEMIRKQLKRPNGLIITTGPTGSGKTTALYSFLQETHNEGIKIITIENPVEYKLEGIVQTQTGEDYTFASGLRAILRQDPDIIMVGEIRDHEVAETAIHAAQTGHLVFSTLHTNSAVAGFARLIDLGIEDRALGNSINMIMGQRLVRLLCEDCKQAYTASAEEKRLVDYVMSSHPYPTEVPDPLTIYRSVGCETCNNSGFRGRMGIFEGVVMDKNIEEAILRDPRETVIAEAAKPQKIPTMLEDGMEKIIQGLTSLPELERVIEFPIFEPDSGEVSEDKKTVASEDDFLSHVV